MKKILFGCLVLIMLASTLVMANSPQERGFYTLPEFHEEYPEEAVLMQAFLSTVQNDPVPVAINVDREINIAWLGPTIEISDAWMRLNKVIRARLNALEIPFNMTEFIIHGDEHDRQATQIQQVLAGNYDYVVIGPSEYMAQKANLEELAMNIPTLVMNVVNPFYDTVGTIRSPLTHIGFDHSVGAELIAQWIINETGGEGTVALMRYIPGLIDQLRSYHFAEYVEKHSNLRVVTEYEADGDQEKAFTGANAVLSRYPNITVMHAGSTAVSLGALAALEERGVTDNVILNGWGGGQNELDYIKQGKIDLTAFRVNDDWGVATAEAIKYHLEGRADQIPNVVAATMEIVHKYMSAEEIDAMTEYAFRYSGDIDR